ncbi:CoA pyrophosphatase [Hydrogenophaga sp. 5NK40-0174]|uniref:CoA pyrophosphatase n=1 Tax=Hydrogenophaga sp. 5NK40-0174 TaxID=3127649 RepID=UPI0033401313
MRPMPSFDPRRVPVVNDPGDTGLPLAHADRMTAEGMRSLFASPPQWVPELRREPRFMDRPPADAAVLIPLVMRDDLTVLLTQRTQHLSTHSGQIAFPGGRLDATDADATAGALREAEEEVGLSPSHVEVLGSLPQYVTGSQFTITPVVALVHPEHTIRPNPHEVDLVFEVPLPFLMNPANHRRHQVDFDGVQRQWFSMPYRDGDTEHYIWGATAGMLRNFYRLLSA